MWAQLPQTGVLWTQRCTWGQDGHFDHWVTVGSYSVHFSALGSKVQRRICPWQAWRFYFYCKCLCHMWWWLKHSSFQSRCSCGSSFHPLDPLKLFVDGPHCVWTKQWQETSSPSLWVHLVENAIDKWLNKWKSAIRNAKNGENSLVLWSTTDETPCN